MAFTETKLKYLLTIALLHGEADHPFRPIDLAVHLGVSRASVSRMLLEFVNKGYLKQIGHSYQLSEIGLKKADEYLKFYQNWYAFYMEALQLSGYDAHECTISLLCSLEPSTIEHLDERIQQFRQDVS